MKHLTRILLFLALAGLSCWLWTVFFPSDEAVIHKRVNRVATLLNFDSKEGNFARVANMEELANLFGPEIEIVINTPWHSEATQFTRAELRQRAFAARTTLSGMTVTFLDLAVTLSPDKLSAEVNLTGQLRLSGSGEMNVQEIKFHLRKVDGTWLIVRVETVRTLA